MKIFVFDDEKLIRRLFERSLSKLGHTVITRENVDEALNTMSSNNFDVFIVDLKLPDCTGMTIIDRIPDLTYRPKKVIVCSTYFNSTIQSDLNIKGVMTLEKPFKLRQLGNILSSIPVSDLGGQEE